MKLTDDADYGTDMAILKSFQLDPREQWHALFADAPTAFAPVWRHAVNLLSQDHAIVTPEYVKAVIEQGFAIQIEGMILRDILRPLHMTREEFREDGLRLLGEKVFAGHVEAMQGVELPLQLLVFGFSQDMPMLFAVGSRGDFHDHSLTGYWAIGQGCHRALDVLNDDPGFRLRPVNEFIYRVCEAKFAAESANSVGGPTFVTLHTPTSNSILRPNAVSDLRTAWRERKNAPPPQAVLDIIETELRPYARLRPEESDL